ncbi:hypothetical protein EV1_023437 [Malus domestica]
MFPPSFTLLLIKLKIGKSYKGLQFSSFWTNGLICFFSEQIRSSSGGKFGLQDFNRPCESSENEARISCDPPAKLFTSDQNKMEKRIKRTLFGIEISESDISSSAMTSQSDAAISESSPNWTIPPSSLSKNLTSIQVSTSVNTSTQSNRASLIDATKQ